MKKKIFIPIIAAILAVIITVVIIIVVNKKPTFNLNDYMTIKTSGYDGYGTAHTSFDGDSLMLDISNELDMTSAEMLNATSILQNAHITQNELSKEETLSNGDKISLKWKMDKTKLEKVSEKIGCNFEYSDFEYTVNNLEKIIEYNPFDDAVITFTGFDGEGKLEFSFAENAPNDISLSYSCSESRFLSEGDVITVTVDNPDYYIEEYGVKITQTEKEYTVEGLTRYFEKLSDISESDKEKIKKYAETVVENKTSEEFDEEGETFKGITYVGEGLREYSYWGNDGVSYVLVYKVDGSDLQGDITYYYYIEYKHIYIDKDNNISYDEEDYNTAVSGNYINNFWYEGYSTLEELIDDLEITDNTFSR